MIQYGEVLEGVITCIVLANGQVLRFCAGRIVPGTQHVRVGIVYHERTQIHTLRIPSLSAKNKNYKKKIMR